MHPHEIGLIDQAAGVPPAAALAQLVKHAEAEAAEVEIQAAKLATLEELLEARITAHRLREALRSVEECPGST